MSEILDKIRATTKKPKNGEILARARIGRAVNKENAGNLSALLAPHLPKAVKAWVKGLEANKVAWDKKTGTLTPTNLPDHKIRAECALYLIQYAVGKAVERTLGVTGNYKELSEVLAELRALPEASRVLAPEIFDTLQSAVEGKETASISEEVPASDSSQNTG